MKKNVVQLLSCVWPLLASACQPPTRIKTVTVLAPDSPDAIGAELIDFKKQTFGTPLPIELSDANCSRRGDAKGLSSDAVLGAFYGYQDTDEETVFITTKILDNRTFARELSNRTDSRYTVQGERRELKICSPLPPADSLEARALQLQKMLDDSFRFYQSIQASSPQLHLSELPAIGLGLFPQYKKDVKRVEQKIRMDGSKTRSAIQTVSVQTDNAFYSPFADDTLSPGNYAISVIPQSLEAKQQGLFDGKGLWEFPVVIHHEYGHHVFQTIFGDSTVLSFQAYLDYWRSHRQLQAIHGPLGADELRGDPLRDKARQAFLSSPGYIFSAVNEGFADLFAYYSLNEAKDIFNISCFKDTREVSSPLLYGGLPKIWDDALWQETFDVNARLGADATGTQADSPIESCSRPSFDDIHVVGAVVAHTVDAVFQSAVTSRPADVTPTLFKARLLMQWLQNLRASDEVLELSSKQTLSRVLNFSLGAALDAIGSNDKTEFCQVVQGKFPALLRRWQDKPAEDSFGVLAACPRS